jgi:hypothetical protein
MFAENLDAFLDVDAGFAVAATLAGAPVRVLFDAPGADVLGGEVTTTEPSILVKASLAAAVGQSLVMASGDLPAHLAHLAGTYKLRSTLPEPPDGAFVRAFMAKVS